MDKTFVEINFSPYATNVLDWIGRPGLFAKNGDSVMVNRSGGGFIIYVNGVEIVKTDYNTAASFELNRRQVGYFC